MSTGEFAEEADFLFPDDAWGEAEDEHAFQLAYETPESSGCFCFSPKPQLVEIPTMKKTYFHVRVLLVADDDEWKADEHAYMRAVMAGKESRLMMAEKGDKEESDGNSSTAYWAAASMYLEEDELSDPFDISIITPCLEQLRTGTMAGFRCKVSNAIFRVNLSGILTPPQLAQSVSELLSENTDGFAAEGEPVKVLAMVKVEPVLDHQGDQPVRRRASLFGGGGSSSNLYGDHGEHFLRPKGDLEMKFQQLKKVLGLAPDAAERLTMERMADMVPVQGTVAFRINALYEKILIQMPEAHLPGQSASDPVFTSIADKPMFTKLPSTSNKAPGGAAKEEEAASAAAKPEPSPTAGARPAIGGGGGGVSARNGGGVSARGGLLSARSGIRPRMSMLSRRQSTTMSMTAAKQRQSIVGASTSGGVHAVDKKAQKKAAVEAKQLRMQAKKMGMNTEMPAMVNPTMLPPPMAMRYKSFAVGVDQAKAKKAATTIEAAARGRIARNHAAPAAASGFGASARVMESIGATLSSFISGGPAAAPAAAAPSSSLNA